jgi:hypothetical protein
MGKHSAITKNRRGGGLLLGAMTSGALAVAALRGAGPPNATCASISGIGGGTDCTSGAGSFAIGIGTDATASAQGSMSGAIAIGNAANAIADGTGDFAFAVGDEAFASAAGGNNNLAIAIGNPDDNPNAPGAVAPNVVAGQTGVAAFSLTRKTPTRAVAGVPQLVAKQQTTTVTSFAAVASSGLAARASSDNNVAISIGNGTITRAGQGSNNSATAFGDRNTATAFNGNGNRAMVVGSDSLASAVGGNQTATAIGVGKLVQVGTPVAGGPGGPAA